MSYVRRYRQHIPFYKSNYPDPDTREYWHNHRNLCDPNCRWGIPIVSGQFLMWLIEDPEPTGEVINFHNGGNSKLYLCCVEDGDEDLCGLLDVEDIQDETLMDHSACVIDGQAYQFNYARFQFIKNAECGLHYFKLVAYEGTDQERIFYSEPVHVYESTRRLYKLNINDSCGIGGINWAKIWQGWPTIDGYEVYLPDGTEAAFVGEVTDKEVEEDGKGNENLLFESRDWRYQFDTALVPEHYAEIVAEITHTDSNTITFPDREHDYTEVIKSAEVDISSDGDGCYVNEHVEFLINRYTKDNCCLEESCDCPEDDAIQAISYTTDQVVAEIGVEVGDTYIVPQVSLGPTWAAQLNNIAVWNGSSWDFTDNDKGLLAYVDDSASYFISEGTAGIWRGFWMFVESATDDAPINCTWTVVSVIPQGMYAKLQFRVNPAGPWMDSPQSPDGPTGSYFSADDWLAGVKHYTESDDTYDLRLVSLNIGCTEPTTSDELTYVQAENCI